MINDRMTEIEESINKLIVDLLVPIRTSKTVDKEVFNKLPMEFAVEAQKLLQISLEGTVG